MNRRWLWGGAAAFTVFALLQLNDPDPLTWILVYGMTALYSSMAAMGRLSRGPVALWGVLAGIGAVVIVAAYEGDDAMGPVWMGPLASESLREAGGLAMIALWSGLLAWVGPKDDSETME